EPCVSQRGHLEPWRRSERRVRPSMHVQDERHSRLFAAAGAEQPDVQLVALRVVDPDLLDRPAKRTEPTAAVIGQLPKLAVLDRVDPRTAATRPHHRHAVAASANRDAYGIGLRQRGDLAVDTKAVWMAEPLVCHQADHVVTVERNERWQTEVLAVHVIAVAAVLDVQVAAGADQLGPRAVDEVQLDVCPRGWPFIIYPE